MDEVRTCTKCGTTHPVGHYYLRRKTPNGKQWRSAWCRSCHAKCQQKWYEKNKEKQDEYRRQWAKQNRSENYDKFRVYEIRKKCSKYGVDESWYHSRVAEQNNLCAICGMPETSKHHAGTPLPLCIDHDHKTGKARALLCWKCNINLHKLEESGWLEKALRYLGRT